MYMDVHVVNIIARVGVKFSIYTCTCTCTCSKLVVKFHKSVHIHDDLLHTHVHTCTCTRMYIVVQTNISTSHLGDEATEQTLGKHLSA